MKYTIQEVIDKKLVVKTPTQEIWDEVIKIFKITDFPEGPYYKETTAVRVHSNTYAYTTYYQEGGNTIIDFEDILIVPEKWCIKITEENLEVVGKYYNREGASCYTNRDNINYYYTSHNAATQKPVTGTNFGACFSFTTVPPGYKEITFEQFKEHILKQKTMDKKIIGYKLKEEFKHLEEAASKVGKGQKDLALFCMNEEYIKTKVIEEKSWTKTIQNLKEAGVWDIWFEPVYEEGAKIIHIGNLNTPVKVNHSGKIEFRGEHTQIQTVQALLEDFKYEPRVIGTSWSTSINEGTRFIKIGCSTEGNVFSIEDLKLIISTYKSLSHV